MQKTQVTVGGSQTTVGSLSRRIASDTTLAPVEQKLKEEVLAVAKKEDAGAGHEQPTGILRCFTDLGLD